MAHRFILIIINFYHKTCTKIVVMNKYKIITSITLETVLSFETVIQILPFIKLDNMQM